LPRAFSLIFNCLSLSSKAFSLASRRCYHYYNYSSVNYFYTCFGFSPSINLCISLSNLSSYYSVFTGVSSTFYSFSPKFFLGAPANYFSYINSAIFIIFGFFIRSITLERLFASNYNILSNNDFNY